MLTKMKIQLVKPALRKGVTDQDGQAPWQADQYHHHQALLRQAFVSRLKGATRLIAHKRGHNASPADCEQSRASPLP